jgi:bacterioferritin
MPLARLAGFEEETMAELDKSKAVDLLNRILEAELAGVVRYTHYSLLVFGFNRIPIVAWLREQAAESLAHAQQAGEMITHLGDYPSLAIGPLLDTHRTDIGTILRESLESEGRALALYKDLLTTAEGKSVMLEEYARQMVQAEELHAGEVDKMLRQSGAVAAFRPEAGQPV